MARHTAHAAAALGALSAARREQVAPALDRMELHEPIDVRDGILALLARQLPSGDPCVIRIAVPLRDADPAPHDLLDLERELATRFSHSAAAPLEHTIVDGVGVHRFGGSRELRTLSDLMDTTRCDPEQAIAMLREVAETLDAAHRAGVLHGMLSSSHILVNERGRVRLFGFCSADETRRGDPPGVPAYRAPEQWSGQCVTAATDQYVLAVIACELLGHQRRRVEELHGAIEEIPPMDVPMLAGWGPTAVMQTTGVLRRALARDPVKRYRSCPEFVQALEQAVARRQTTTPVAVTAVAPGEQRRGLAAPAMLSLVIVIGAFMITSADARADVSRAVFGAWSRMVSLVASGPARLDIEQRLPTVDPPTLTGGTSPAPRPVGSARTPGQESASPPPSADVPTEFGFLRVTVAGGEGRLLLNGEDSGPAPGGVSLSPGSHLVRVVAGDARVTPAERRVVVRAGDTTSVGFRIERTSAP